MNKILKVVTPSIIVGSSIAFPIAVFSSDNSDEPSIINNFRLSTKKGSENLIEIFTDGYDFFNEEKLMPDPSYNDFKMFKYAYTAGHFTVVGKVTALGGLKDFNIYKLQQRNPNYWDNTYGSIFHTSEGTNVMNKHLNVDRSYFGQVSVLNGYDNFSEGTHYIKYYGDTNVVKSKFPGIDYVNWSGARDANTGNWGISNQHPDKAAFELVPKRIKLVDEPGRIFLQTNIAHEPIISDNQGNGTQKSSPEKIASANHNMIGHFLDSLKSVQDTNGRSVYDNSMIVIWGDHASTLRSENTIDNMAHSNVVLKFPDQKQSKLDIVTDKLFYMPQLNNLIDTYFTNKPSNPYDAIFSQPEFSLNRTIGINTDTEYQGTGMFEWHFDPATQGIVKGKYLGDFDRLNTTQADDIYRQIEDGGDYHD